ncbi:hypothetical protein [Pedobacter aquatilis]|uniref:hypothetical protein n=1 Tax=Pedobacter aquatilis TaxID=351343 RepID=UPI00292DF526|nr:hypothetical protein [Pedobacter aquatilis]
MSRKINLLILIIFLASCKKEISDDERISYPYTMEATEIISSQAVRMYTDHGIVRDQGIIADFLKRHGGLAQFKPQPRYQVEFLSKDSARIDLAPDIYKIENLDSGRFIMRSDVQLLKNIYSSTALESTLIPYKLNRFNRNLRAIPQVDNYIKAIYKCELSYFTWFRNNQLVMPVITYKLNLYNRRGYYNGVMYGIWNLAFPSEIQSRDTLVFQELRVGFTKK